MVLAATPALRAGLRALIASDEVKVVGDGFAGGAAPAADVVVVGDASSARDLPQILDSTGARGVVRVVPPDADAAALGAAIVAAAAGFGVHPAEWPDAAPPPELTEPLTGREREVLELVALGYSNRSIADRLRISDHTVKFHLSSILGKLGAANRTEAVREGFRRGLITI
jgi:DNA-binding NarL/FixJ family response regulator